MSAPPGPTPSVLTGDNNVDAQGVTYFLDSPASGQATVSGYSGSATAVSIPSQVSKDGTIYTVTLIGPYVYANSSINSVTIPDSVLSIQRNAFEWCSNLTSVTIGNSVTSIGFAAFYQNSALASLTIGNSVTSIGGYAFRNCIALASVTIPDSVLVIGDTNVEPTDAFASCINLTSVTIGNSVTSIGPGTFQFCTQFYYIRLN